MPETGLFLLFKKKKNNNGIIILALEFSHCIFFLHAFHLSPLLADFSTMKNGGLAFVSFYVTNLSLYVSMNELDFKN